MNNDWKKFKGEGDPTEINWADIPVPPWRRFASDQQDETTQKGKHFIVPPKAIATINAAIYLRRPILVTGEPGTGKTTLAYRIAYELSLGNVLVWPINTRSTLKEGLYYYDAIARLQDSQLLKPEDKQKSNIGQYIRLGPLGTAMYPQTKPRVLLIDEIDKSDIDLPNDLLNLLEEGRFEIPELTRLSRQNAENSSPIAIENQDAENPSPIKIQNQDGDWIPALNGQIACTQFPIVIMTSNGEQDFPLPFKRRCLPLFINRPNHEQLTAIVKAHFDLDPKQPLSPEIDQQIKTFITKQEQGKIATDQLLNVIFMLRGDNPPTGPEKDLLVQRLLSFLNEDET